MTDPILKVHPGDNIIVALDNLSGGQRFKLNGTSIDLVEDIPLKHKFSEVEMAVGDPVYMYGVLIGKAIQPVSRGGKITTSNITNEPGDYTIGERKLEWNKPNVSKWKDRTFMGYHRADGRVGTMNYWLVIPLVFCENRNVNVIREALLDELGYRTEKTWKVDTRNLVQQYKRGENKETLLNLEIIQSPEQVKENRLFPNVDGIKFLNHNGGCGETGDSTRALCNLLASYITHPNVAGATILSLGCQGLQIKYMKQAIEIKDSNFSKPVFFLEQQKTKSERELVAQAVKETFVGMMEANKIERKPADLSHITLGLECGGSDGFSGLSANPALGHSSDILVALGGTPILAEFPELHGVEQELVNRCTTEDLAKRFQQLITDYRLSVERSGNSFLYNSSPGNIRDGLITGAMKSAGAAKKGGTSPVTGVLDYTETATNPGLNLLCTPGGDVESTTALAGSGANVIVFTTGLGTPTGNAIAPTIKLATNSIMATKLADIIDVDAGTIITGEDTIESKGEELFDYIIKVASGEAIPKAVQLGQDDFIPWKRGVSM